MNKENKTKQGKSTSTLGEDMAGSGTNPSAEGSTRETLSPQSTNGPVLSTHAEIMIILCTMYLHKSICISSVCNNQKWVQRPQEREPPFQS